MTATYEPTSQHYRHRREPSDRHAAAKRHLFNKLLGQLKCIGVFTSETPPRGLPRVEKVRPIRLAPYLLVVR